MNLPRNVYAVKDRHGKTRYRFNKRGLPSRYLPAPTAPEFQQAYEDCFDPATHPARRPKRQQRVRLSAVKGVSVVYFVGGTRGPVKIGTTVDLPGRLKKLQTGCPFRLSLLAVTPGGVSLESEYHRRFEAHRLAGEWFQGAAIRAEINRLKKVRWCPTSYPAKLSNLCKGVE